MCVTSTLMAKSDCRLHRQLVCHHAGAVRICEASLGDLGTVTSFTADIGVIGMTKQEIRKEFDAGRMCPEWTWMATDDAGHLIGRALWWGRDDRAPIALEVLDVAGPIESRAGVGSALLRAGHDALGVRGWQVPLPHTVRLPVDWRSDQACVDAVAWRQLATAEAGLTQVNERLQFEWAPGAERPPASPRLEFRPAPDDEFLRLFSEVAVGSLDVMTQRTLAVSSTENLARDELDFYIACPGERGWWRVAIDASGTMVGFVIPSATPHSRNVGYLGVLPACRGQGYVDDLLAHATTFHHAAGATRITATTDATNVPMAKAFTRHGYRNVETRLDLEVPSN